MCCSKSSSGGGSWRGSLAFCGSQNSLYRTWFISREPSFSPYIAHANSLPDNSAVSEAVKLEPRAAIASASSSLPLTNWRPFRLPFPEKVLIASHPVKACKPIRAIHTRWPWLAATLLMSITLALALLPVMRRTWPGRENKRPKANTKISVSIDRMITLE